MGLLHPAVQTNGFRMLFEPAEKDLSLLGFGLLSLQPEEVWEKLFADAEAALVIFSGRAEICAQQNRWQSVGERSDVFSGAAAAFYLPAGCPLSVRAQTEFHAALVTSPAEPSGSPVEIRPRQVSVREAGQGSWRRRIHTIIGEGVPAQRLLVGETFNEPGKWSSFPPHKHDRDIPGEEGRLEEVYHFRIDPPWGFGLQRIYSSECGLDEAYVVKNGDTVAIPRGYHPVVAAPECRLYYLWALAGSSRELLPSPDPKFAPRED